MPTICSSQFTSLQLTGYLKGLLAAAVLLVGTTAAPAQEASLSYTVKPGDKLIVLARTLLGSPAGWNEVARFNGMRDPNVLRPGQVLKVPIRLLKFEPVAGRLLSAEGTVQVGQAPAVAGNAITEGAHLQTGAESSAVVELADGSRFQLLPGSLAEVVTSRDYALDGSATNGGTKWFAGLIRLSYGAIETLAAKFGRRAAPLEVVTPTVSVGVRGTRFRVAHDATAGNYSRAEVLDGLVRADNRAQQSGADLPRGTGAVIDPTQKEVHVVPLLPAPGLSSLPSDLIRPQTRSWPMPALAGATAFRVQIASDTQFDRIVRDLLVRTPSADISSLANGTWHARLRGIDAQSLEGFDSVMKITIRDAPSRWRVTDSRLSLENGKARLHWSGALPDGQPLPAGNYSAEIAADALLTQATAQPLATPGQMDLGDLKPGRYYIRITSTGPKGPPAVSEIYLLDVPGNWGFTVIDLASALQPAGQ